MKANQSEIVCVFFFLLKYIFADSEGIFQDWQHSLRTHTIPAQSHIYTLGFVQFKNKMINSLECIQWDECLLSQLFASMASKQCNII